MSLPQVIGALRRVQQPDMPVTPGTTSTGNSRFQPPPHVHEGAVEERIAFGQQADRLARLAAAPRSRRLPRAIEVADLRRVVGMLRRHLVGHRIFERAVPPRPLPISGVDDAARIAGLAALGEIGDDIDRAHQAGRAQREVADVAGPTPMP